MKVKLVITDENGLEDGLECLNAEVDVKFDMHREQREFCFPDTEPTIKTIQTQPISAHIDIRPIGDAVIDVWHDFIMKGKGK